MLVSPEIMSSSSLNCYWNARLACESSRTHRFSCGCTHCTTVVSRVTRFLNTWLYVSGAPQFKTVFMPYHLLCIFLTTAIRYCKTIAVKYHIFAVFVFFFRTEFIASSIVSDTFFCLWYLGFFFVMPRWSHDRVYARFSPLIAWFQGTRLLRKWICWCQSCFQVLLRRPWRTVVDSK